jgi:hypothetical protein
MVYDSVNDVMIAFRTGCPVSTYALDLRANRWEELPAASPAPSHVLFDAAYDPERNVVVLTGGEEGSVSGALTVRETWTYRYRPAKPATANPFSKPARPPLADVPQSPRLAVKAGRVRLTWDPVDGEPAGYAVYRGEGESTWAAEMIRVNDEPLAEAAFEEPLPTGGRSLFCQVRTVRQDGSECPPSTMVRNAPRPPNVVQSAPSAAGAVRMKWPRPADDAAWTYRVRRAPVASIDLWSTHFDPMTDAGEFEVITPEPISEPRFVDHPPGLADAIANESTWPQLYAYTVTAIDKDGVESGPSPVTLSIAPAPGPVTVVPLPEGGFLVISGGGDSNSLLGNQLPRLDTYRGDLTFRISGAPQAGTVFVDDARWPAGDRCCYCVVSVDDIGQYGIPSSLAWARNMP